MSDSLNNKELVAVGHDFAKALSTDTPIIDIAKILTRLAERLDCTTAALREKGKQCDALAAEVYDLKHPGTYLPSKRDTPALDVFLDEMRAQGADECVRQLVISDADDDFCDAPNVCAMVAHQLRKGGAA